MNFQICNFKLFFGRPYCAITQALNMQGFGNFSHDNCIFSSQIELTKNASKGVWGHFYSNGKQS